MKEKSILKIFFSYYRLYPLYAFLFTVILYAAALSGAGVLGNGLDLLETSDWMTQHIPFIMQMGEVVKGNRSLWYSWNMAIGSGSIGSYAYYSFSPFNVFYWICGENGKHIASALVIILKAGFSAAAFQIFITSLLHRIYYETIIFSILYALNGFVVCDFHSILSLDAVMIFPVIAFGMVELVRKNRIITLTASYSYLFFTSLYMGYIAGICSFIIFIFYYSYNIKDMGKRKGLQILVRYFQSVFTAMGMTAIIWIPSALNMFELKNSDELYENVVNCNPIMLLNNMFAGMYQSIDGFIPYYYCGLLSVIAVPLFIKNKHIKSRKRLFYILCLLSFTLIMLIPPLNYALHGFDNPNGVGYRYAFVVSFILVTILSEQYVFMIAKKEMSFRHISCWILFCVMIFTLGKYNIIKNMGDTSDSNKWYVLLGNIILLLAIYGLARVYNSKNLDTVTKRVLFTLVMLLEMTFNIAVIQNRIPSRGSVIVDEHYAAAEKNTIKMIREDSVNDLYVRTVYQDPHIVNIALENNLSALVYFSSLINGRLVDALRSLGYEYGSNTISGNGWSPITTSLLGIDYIVDGACILSDDPSVPVMLGTEANEHFYQNYIKNYKVLPLAFSVDKKIMDYNPDESVFDNQNNLLSAMTGREIACYKPVNMTTDIEHSEGVSVESKDGETIIINKNYPDKEALLEYRTTHYTDNEVYVNLYNDRTLYKDSVYWRGPIVSAEYNVNVYHTVNQRIYPNQIFKCGDRNEAYNSFVMKIPPDIEKVTYKKGYFVEYDEKEFDKAYRELDSHGMIITEFRDGCVEGNIDCSEDCILFSSIPYEKGWRAYIDGAESDIIPLVEEAFLGLELTKGSHEIVLEYIAPGMYAGRCVTIGTVLLLLSSTMILRRRYSGKAIH